jgi:integrating conjugative element protein (TIGR03755 family)
MNALLKAEETINLVTKSCEQMEAEIAQGKDPFREWVTLSKGHDWRLEMGTGGGDIVEAKQEVEERNGSNGVPWLGGMRGGEDQEPIEVVADTVRAGYNVTVNQGADAKTSKAPDDSRLAAVWPSSKEAIEWARDTLGDVIVRTCEDCPPSGIPGTGLLPGLEKTREEVDKKLTELVDETQQPTQENLEQVSAPGMGVGVNVELIRAIQDLTPDERPMLTAKLAGEAAQAQVLEKTLLLRRLMLAGRQVPEIAASGPGQAQIDRKLAELDQEIDNLLFETKVRKEVMSDTAASLLDEVHRRRGESLAVPYPPSRDPSPYRGGAVVPPK